MQRRITLPIVCLAIACLVAPGAREIHGRTDTETATGSVHGTVAYRGKIPRSTYPDDLGRLRPLLDVDEKTGALQYAVVYLQVVGDPQPSSKATAAGGGSSTGRRSGQQASAAEPVVVDQRDMSFVPHLIAVREGQTVEFTNSDAANHNVRSTSLDRRNQFNVLTPASGSYKRSFVAERKQRPLRLGCEIHAWMRAWVYVFDHPYFSVTDAKGRFAVERVPPGIYRLELRQPDGGLQATHEIRIDPGKAVTVDFPFTEDDLNLPGK
jgi:plastocyanin